MSETRQQSGHPAHFARQGGSSAQRHSGRSPLVFSPAPGGGDALDVPVPGIAPETVEVTRRLRSARMDVLARRRDGSEEFFLPSTTTVARLPSEGSPPGHVRSVHTTAARSAPDTLNSGRNAGVWDLKVRITSCGWQRDTDLPIALHIATDGASLVVVDHRRRDLLVRARRSARRRARAVVSRLRTLL